MADDRAEQPSLRSSYSAWSKQRALYVRNVKRRDRDVLRELVEAMTAELTRAYLFMFWAIIVLLAAWTIKIAVS